jgi:hypothetical protein
MSSFIDHETGEVIETPIQGDLPVPYGGGMNMMVHGGVVSAQRVALPRDNKRVLSSMRTQAQQASTDWYYQLPVKSKDGTKKAIEGPSIQCAMAAARAYGNCQVDCAAEETANAYIFTAKFVDIETGFTVIRPFRQRKGAAAMGRDRGRNEDMDFQIGASKAMRNVICNAISDVTDYAWKEAKKSIVEAIGKNMEKYRARAIERYNELGIDLTLVERIYGKKSAEWLAPDIAKMVSEIQAISDGMALAADFYPDVAPEPTPEPEKKEEAAKTETDKAADPKPEKAKEGLELNPNLKGK